MSSPSKPKFGHGMRQHFLFDANWTNLNHGCFGTYPRQVADVRSDLIERVERRPDVFMRYDHLPLLQESRRLLAEYLHVPVDEVVIVTNTTLGVTTVLRNLTFKEKDVVLHLESVYDAVEMTLASMQETSPQICLRKVDYGSGGGDSTKPVYPQSHDGICESFTQTVSQLQAEGYNVKVAIFETISSVPGVRLPFERLTKICRDQGILSLIDGAHGIGQIPLDLGELDADFFISNCHKWLYVPRGCAVFHVPRRNHHLIRTAFPTSWEFELRSQQGMDSPDRFLNQFRAQATADNTPFYCIPAALEMRRQVCGGERAIFEYSKEMAQRGADIVARKLGTVVLQKPEREKQDADGDGTTADQYTGLRDCAMSNVLLPLTINDSSPHANSITSDNVGKVTSWMQRVVPADYNTSVSFFAYRGRIWVRLMGQIYLELSDFEWFADILVELCKRVEAGEPFS